jgi:hypothetical protein
MRVKLEGFVRGIDGYRDWANCGQGFFELVLVVFWYIHKPNISGTNTFLVEPVMKSKFLRPLVLLQRKKLFG